MHVLNGDTTEIFQILSNINVHKLHQNDDINIGGDLNFVLDTNCNYYNYQRGINLKTSKVVL